MSLVGANTVTHFLILLLFMQWVDIKTEWEIALKNY